MSYSTFVAILLLTLLVPQGSSEDCFSQVGDDWKVPGSCTPAKVALFVKEKKLSFEIAGTGPEKSSKLELKVGGCDLSAMLTMRPRDGGSSFEIDQVGTLKFPIEVTANSKGSIDFTGKPSGEGHPTSHHVACSPVFKKAGEGFVIDVDYSLSERVPGLSITFKDAHDYSSVAKKGGLPTWGLVVLIVGSILLVIALLLVGLFFFFRWYKARAIKRQQDEAVKPAEKKPEVIKPAEKPETSKPAEKPEPMVIVTKVDETKPEEPKGAPKKKKAKASKASKKAKKSKKSAKAKEGPKVKPATPIQDMSTDDGLLTAKDGSFKKKSAESNLKTPDFVAKRTDRMDIFEVTARDETKTNTRATADATSEATSETPLELLPYKIPAQLEFLVKANDEVKELLSLVCPQRRYTIYFGNRRVEVFDAASRVLAEIEVASKKGGLNEDQLAELQDEVISIKDLAAEIHKFVGDNPKKARLPWSYTKTLELGFLTDSQIDKGCTWDPPTESQGKAINADLWELRQLLKEKKAAKDPTESALKALIEQIETLEEQVRSYHQKLKEAKMDEAFEMADKGEL